GFHVAKADAALPIDRVSSCSCRDASHVEVMGLLVVEPDPGAFLKRPNRHDHVLHDGRRAATDHQPASLASSITCHPASASTGRNSSRSASSIPEKIATPSGNSASRIAGSNKVLTLRRMFEQTRSTGPNNW